jgi:hypothetical protein
MKAMPYIITTLTCLPFIICYLVDKSKKNGIDKTNYCPGAHLRFYAGAKKEETPLTPKERKAYEVLSKVSDHTFTGFCIQTAIKRGGTRNFRQLIRELNEQITDAPIGLERSIGKEACEVVKSISHSS